MVEVVMEAKTKLFPSIKLRKILNASVKVNKGRKLLMMNGCTTLEELNTKFTDLISSLKQKIDLRDGLVSGNEHLNDILVEVKAGVSNLEVELVLMRSELNRRKQALQSVQILKTQVEELQRRANHASENLPQRLPSQKQSTTDIPASAIPVTPKFRQKARTFLTPLSTCHGSMGSISPSEAPSVRQIKKKAPTLFVPTVDYITVQEFDSIPKYMKGRITYEQINGAIDEFNKAVTSKYRLIATPRTKQTDKIKNMIWDYKQQETKDTKGIWFVVDADVKQFSTIKMDSIGRNLFTILRHFNKVKEIRTKGTTRYSVVV